MKEKSTESHAINTVFILRTVNSLGWSSTMPFFAVYLEKIRLVSLVLIGAVYLVSGVFTLIASVLGGALTDRYGSKRVALAGYVSSVVSASLTGYMIRSAFPVYPLLVIYPLFSLFRGLSGPATSAIVASLSGRERVIRGFSLQTVGGNLGFGLGPAIGGFLAYRLGYSSVFALSAGTAAAATAYGYLRLADVRPRRAKARDLFRLDRYTWGFMAVVFIAFTANGSVYTPLSLYSAKYLSLNNQEIGLLFTTNGLLIALLQIPMMGTLSRFQRISPTLAMTVTACATLALPFSRGFLDTEAAMAVATVGEILLTVPTQVLASSLSRAENRGTVQGIFLASETMGRSFANFLFPSLFSEFSYLPSAGWYVASIISLASAAGFLGIAKEAGNSLQSSQV
jgi:predicted MFS family arabinose efflux permease